MLKMTVRQAKNGFFDRKTVLNALDRARLRVLSRQGALVRTIARRSMKKKKGPAPAGMPPNVHEGQIKDHLYFAYDAKAERTVVGPAKLGKGKAPGTLEKGGTVLVDGIVDRRGRFVPLALLKKDRRAAAAAAGKLVRKPVKVAARPFMVPALRIAQPKLAGMWKNQVRR